MKRLVPFGLFSILYFVSLVPSAQAVIELLEVRRVSGRILVPIQGEQITIYGGIAGELCDDLSPTQLCDSCAEVTSLKACNTQRIFDDLLIQFEFRSNSVAGFPLLRTNQSEIVPAQNSLVIQPVGATQILEVRWGDVCRLIPNATNCENAQGQVQLNLGVTPERDQANGGDVRAIVFKVGGPVAGTFDTNEGCDTPPGFTNVDQGICDFTAFPGDGKVFITDLASGRGFPQVSGLEAESLRVFVSDQGFISRPSDSLEPQTLRLAPNDKTNLEKRDVDRLENGTRYFFRVATVDVAGNVANFTGNETIKEACGADPATPGYLDSIRIDCPYAARPDEVLGLLTEDFNCFIASATLGNPLAPSINVLREFRSQILSQYTWGKSFIRWYYKKGPYAARWIADHTWVQWLLTPFIWAASLFAGLSLKLGFWMGLVVFTVIPLAVSSMALLKPWRRRSPLRPL